MAITAETLKTVAKLRKQLEKMTTAQALALTRAWVEAWDVLAPEFTAAITELLAAAKDGRITQSMAAKNIRLRDALQQARAMLDELATNTNSTITNDVSQAIVDALDGHAALIRTQLPPGAAGASISFTRISPEAIAAMVKRTTETIHKTTRTLPADVERMMKKELIRGVAVGTNPRVTAGRIIKATEGRFNGGLTRALTIARTETLDVHRAATQASEKANTDVCAEWEWHSALTGRTCIACWAQHGSRHPITEAGPDDHQNGRCARVTITKTWAELGFKGIDEPPSLTQDSEAVFNALPVKDQRAIMGNTRHDLYTSGQAKWGDLNRTLDNPGWRPSIGITPVKDL